MKKNNPFTWIGKTYCEKKTRKKHTPTNTRKDERKREKKHIYPQANTDHRSLFLIVRATHCKGKGYTSRVERKERRRRRMEVKGRRRRRVGGGENCTLGNCKKKIGGGREGRGC